LRDTKRPIDHGRMWVVHRIDLPNCSRILPAFSSTPAGNAVNVT
jgi:hypothetical protein